MQTRNRAPTPGPVLPQELITEMLLRAPAKSIGKFRCVSKQWRSFLSSPHFIESHRTLHSIRSPPKLIMISSTSHSLFTLTFSPGGNNRKRSDAVSRKIKKFQVEWKSLLGSCHGLVLVGDCDYDQFLMNPTTLEMVYVPDFSLALDPRTSLSHFGFGYDSSGDDYKIVRLSYHYVLPIIREVFVDVYNLKMKTWRRIEDSAIFAIPRNMLPGVFLNGAIHWMGTDYSIAGSSTVVFAFDLGNEKFKRVPAPSSVVFSLLYSNQLFVLGGCLGMLCDGFNADSAFHDHVDLWVMNEYGVQES